jgi:hypothetical protein
MKWPETKAIRTFPIYSMQSELYYHVCYDEGVAEEALASKREHKIAWL